MKVYFENKNTRDLFDGILQFTKKYVMEGIDKVDFNEKRYRINIDHELNSNQFELIVTDKEKEK